MSQDNNDDPFAPLPDRTMMRPKPGRRAAVASGEPPPEANRTPPNPPARARSAAAVGNASLGEFATAGLNPLVQAGTPLLVLAGRLRSQVSQADVDALRRQTEQEVRAFEERCRAASVPPEDVRACRYALCTAVDEAVMNTPWGSQSGWSGNSLLVNFERDVSGGEKFFQILERISTQPQRFIAALELFYICLALGFEGKYRLEARGASKLADERTELYRRIQSVRGAPETALSPHWRGVEDRRNAVVRFVPLWVVIAASVAILICAYIFFGAALNSRTEPLNATLAQVGLDAPSQAAPGTSPVASGVPSSTGLKQSLAAQISGGLISVDEDGGRADITLLSPDLFSSGSARVNPQYVPLLQQLGAALNGLPGRIVIVGHTDNRPIRSLDYKDNYELSRDRAQHVADLIRPTLTNPSRLDATGVGPSRPRYLPEDVPANQARNRRVEIIYRREG